jgi:hypothetical protein
LATALLLFLAGVVTGQLGDATWNWIRASLVAVSAMALMVVAAVPDRFLD